MNENSELVTSDNQAGAMARQQLPVIAPQVDIFENEQEILLYADMPGVGKDDIAINIDNGKMTLSAIRRLSTSGAATWREFGDIEFRRNFSVPQSIDTANICAELKDGSLCLHLPKSATAKPRQIDIKAA